MQWRRLKFLEVWLWVTILLFHKKSKCKLRIMLSTRIPRKYGYTVSNKTSCVLYSRCVESSQIINMESKYVDLFFIKRLGIAADKEWKMSDRWHVMHVIHLVNSFVYFEINKKDVLKYWNLYMYRFSKQIHDTLQ